jgi:Cu(I)/Ag(I) efflux system periplasmic protein CusF
MQRKQKLFLALAVSAAALLPLHARAAGDHAKHAAGAAASDMADGEVRKVDKEGAKLTIKHGEIKNLEMPAMTMVFNVKDKAMLDKVQTGDKIKFKAVNDSGKYTVTEIQPAH